MFVNINNTSVDIESEPNNLDIEHFKNNGLYRAYQIIYSTKILELYDQYELRYYNDNRIILTMEDFRTIIMPSFRLDCLYNYKDQFDYPYL